MSDWRRVTRRHPCPICGRAGWCAVTANGELCLCMRNESDWPAKEGMGGYFHRLTAEPTKHVTVTPTRQRTLFDDRRRATVNDWLIRQLTLSEAHCEHLSGPQRLLDHEQIARRGYRTWPARKERQRLAELALAEFGSLMHGFPGFHIDRAGRAAFAGASGLLLPVRDARNVVTAFQIRPDDTKLAKRIWLSSAGRREGTGSGAPAHWAWPRCLDDPFTAYVVEGVLSADICADILGTCCIGLSGKSNWRMLDAARMNEELIDRVVIALDQDEPCGETNSEAFRLAEFLSRDLHVQLARWDGSRAKGFDDCLNDQLGFKVN